jgi:hypothetical protein
VVKKPRSGRWAWVGAALAIGVATAGAVVALSPGRNAPDVEWHTAGNIEAPPAQDASATEWNAWARRAVDATVAGQAEALVAGNEEGYLAVVDPEARRLHDLLAQRYEVLRKMGIGQWSQEINGRPDARGQLAWRANVRVTYCFGDSTCRPSTVTVGTDWRLDGDHLVLTDQASTNQAQYGPRPWETGSNVAVATGARTIVVTSGALSSRLSATLEAAEHAASVADTLAKWDGPPNRYVVFLAGGSDWTEWYGTGKPDWAAAMYIDVTDNEVLVNSLDRGYADTLVHELTHVSTLAGDRKGPNDVTTWWMVEGIAEYARMLGRPVSQYEGLSEVRSYIRATGGDPVVDIPGVNASLEEATGAYGVAFLAIRRLADRYGQDAMLDFWGRIVHDGETFEQAAPAAFGQTWSAVRSDCQTYIRSI